MRFAAPGLCAAAAVAPIRARPHHPKRHQGLANRGYRLDYHLATPGVAALARKERIHTESRFSDHAPLTIDYDFDL